MDRIKIGDKAIGENKPVLIIAEAGINHNRDINIARKLVDAACAAGADAVKFQTFKAEGFISDRKMAYSYVEAGKEKTESQFDMFKRLELPFEWHKELKEHAEKKGLIFMSTPGDEECTDFLENLGVAAFKIGSDDLTNLRLIKYIARKDKPVIISTGMSLMKEIESAVKAFYSTGNKKLILLHCSSEYPANMEHANLMVIKTLKNKFNVPVGFSDHMEGINAAIASVALGACIIEKHFTLDKNMKGPDHRFSSDPKELKGLVDACRQAKKALGKPVKYLTKEEEHMRKIARKTIVAARSIRKGTKISELDIAFKRCNSIGFEPKFYEKILGKTALKEIKRDEPITGELLK